MKETIKSLDAMALDLKNTLEANSHIPFEAYEQEEQARQDEAQDHSDGEKI